MPTAADYPEDLVPILLQTALAMPGFPHVSMFITPVSRRQERNLGYDAKVDLTMYVFYMQFKKPSSIRRGRIISERQAQGLKYIPPQLYFDLHRDEKTGKHLQHNLLHRLLKAGERAAYVCPLFLNGSLYQASTQQAVTESMQSWLRRIPRHAFIEDLIFLRGRGLQSGIQIADIPVFKDHVSIPPHGEIRDKKPHRYSFTPEGEDVCFHSPMAIEAAVTFDRWLLTAYEASRSTSFRPGDRNRLAGLMESLGPFAKDFILPEETSMQSWQEFGGFLEEEYGIRQYAMIRRQGQ